MMEMFLIILVAIFAILWERTQARYQQACRDLIEVHERNAEYWRNDSRETWDRWINSLQDDDESESE
jgi:Ca2+-dependent lipid-binding protein